MSETEALPDAALRLSAEESAARLVRTLAGAGLLMVTAESCTGGLIASLVTALPGASVVFWGGFVPYGIEAKEAMLGLPGTAVSLHGQVSRETALAMLAGTLRAAGGGGGRGADLAVAVTGWAGPDAPADEGGPGRVVIAWGRRAGEVWSSECRFPGNRGAVRLAAAAMAMQGLARLAVGEPPHDSARRAELRA